MTETSSLASEVEELGRALTRTKLGTASRRHSAKISGEADAEHPADKHPDPPQSREARQGKLKHLGGSMNDRFNVDLLNTTMGTLWPAAHGRDPSDFVWASLNGIAPQDELEGMLAAQMTAAHAASMECFRRAMLDQQTVEAREMNLRMATKASRTYAALLEALDRRRGKGGKQTVTVEHVHRHIHVHENGAPISGVIEASRGARGSKKIGRQPHAQPAALAHAPQPPLRSEDKSREPVPIARDDERQMPDARRR